VTVYSVYEPPTQAPDLALRADRLAFVKEGFSWIAFLVPLLWLIFYRMWVEFILLALVYVVLQLALGGSGPGHTLVGWASLAIAVLFAFEANDLRAASLVRRGYRLVGVASGRGRTEAERSFFSVWLPEQARTARGPQRTHEPRREVEAEALMPRGEGEEVIGLFPRP
jgi:Protein of unknown function (DUF2628)